MKFKIGDKVVITNNGRKPSYDDVVDCFGVIKYIREYKIHEHDEITYYVSIPNKRNMNQIDGWWCCDEDMLAPYRPEICYKNSLTIVDDPICVQTQYTREDIENALKQVYNRFNKKGEQNNMEILEIYRERKLEKLKTLRDKKAETIKKCDKGYAFLTQLSQDLINKYDKNVSNCVSIAEKVYVFNETIQKLLEDNATEYIHKVDKLNKLTDEVASQLDMCETYDQKQDILYRYNVLKDGKINA